MSNYRSSKLREFPRAQIFSDREFCYRCNKVQKDCLCSSIVEVDNKTHVAVLQHPHEKRMPISTGRLSYLSLQNASWFEGVCFDEDPKFVDWLENQENVVLLFPSPDATLITELPQKPSTFLAIDGTWNEAKKMLHRSKCLQKVQKVVFIPPHESRYQIRKEPHPDYFSTIEAIHHCLTTWEPDTECQPLIDIFLKMIERQKSYIGQQNARHHNNKQQKEKRALQKRINWWLYSMSFDQMLSEIKALSKQELMDI